MFGCGDKVVSHHGYDLEPDPRRQVEGPPGGLSYCFDGHRVDIRDPTSGSTPLPGTHCPTAPVQSVTRTSACCGKVLAIESHKPRPGENGFVQCRCAEKRSTQHQAALNQGPPHFDMLPIRPVLPVLPARIPEALVASTPAARVVAVATIPLVPPPSVV